MTRSIGALLLGIIITLGLFWLMQYMLLKNQQGLAKTSNIQMVEFVRLKKASKTQIKDRKVPEKPPLKKRPPPPKIPIATKQLVQQNVPEMDIPNLDIPLQTKRFTGSMLSGVQMGAGKVSTNVIPLVRIAPRYPMRAASRRIEGWVKIEFTITETGTTKDAKVVESQPGKIFDSAALKAIEKWKFKPKVIDGEAFEQQAMQVLKFKLKK